MPNKEITFTIEDGAVKVEASGFTGTSCDAATKYFTDALGGQVSDRVNKPEYFKRAIQKTGETQKAGA